MCKEPGHLCDYQPQRPPLLCNPALGSVDGSSLVCLPGKFLLPEVLEALEIHLLDENQTAHQGGVD